LQIFSPIFSFGFDGYKFGSGKLPILRHYEMLYRRLHGIGKSQPLAKKIKIKSAAQHQTLRGRKHIYKIIIGSDVAGNSSIFKCVQPADGNYFEIHNFELVLNKSQTEVLQLKR
jgi:hypothetical protein